VKNGRIFGVVRNGSGRGGTSHVALGGVERSVLCVIGRSDLRIKYVPHQHRDALIHAMRCTAM